MDNLSISVSLNLPVGKIMLLILLVNYACATTLLGEKQ